MLPDSIAVQRRDHADGFRLRSFSASTILGAHNSRATGWVAYEEFQMKSALIVGGTGPSGPFLVNGLRDRGYEVTILHRGTHEIPEIPEGIEHIHADPHFRETLEAAIAGRNFDVVIATYGRIRVIAETLAGKTRTVYRDRRRAGLSRLLPALRKFSDGPAESGARRRAESSERGGASLFISDCEYRAGGPRGPSAGRGLSLSVRLRAVSAGSARMVRDSPHARSPPVHDFGRWRPGTDDAWLCRQPGTWRVARD